jgi:hypothetical protein
MRRGRRHPLADLLSPRHTIARQHTWRDASSSVATDERARKAIGEIYRPLSLNQAPVMYTERRTAELIKYAATPSSPPRSPSSTRSPTSPIRRRSLRGA